MENNIPEKIKVIKGSKLVEEGTVLVYEQRTKSYCIEDNTRVLRVVSLEFYKSFPQYFEVI